MNNFFINRDDYLPALRRIIAEKKRQRRDHTRESFFAAWALSFRLGEWHQPEMNAAKRPAWHNSW
jgi:hypothetical protein